MNIRTDVAPADLGTHEPEFAKICQGRKTHYNNCGRPAEWIVWVSHTRAGCPNERFLCDICKRRCEQYMINTVPLGGRCTNCRTPVSGTDPVSKHLRFIRL